MTNKVIKFRTWNKKNNTIQTNTSLYDLGIYCENVGLNNIFNYEDVIFMQFTGLFDKNGKEIYEGDVLKYKLDNKLTYNVSHVLLYNGGFMIDDLINYLYTILDNSCGKTGITNCEIIGNIYENPDLINKK